MNGRSVLSYYMMLWMEGLCKECHDVGLLGEVYDLHKYISPFLSLYFIELTLGKPFVNIERERESGDIKRWETEPYFCNPTS